MNEKDLRIRWPLVLVNASSVFTRVVQIMKVMVCRYIVDI